MSMTIKLIFAAGVVASASDLFADDDVQVSLLQIKAHKFGANVTQEDPILTEAACRAYAASFGKRPGSDLDKFTFLLGGAKGYAKGCVYPGARWRAGEGPDQTPDVQGGRVCEIHWYPGGKDEQLAAPQRWGTEDWRARYALGYKYAGPGGRQVGDEDPACRGFVWQRHPDCDDCGTFACQGVAGQNDDCKCNTPIPEVGANMAGNQFLQMVTVLPNRAVLEGIPEGNECAIAGDLGEAPDEDVAVDPGNEAAAVGDPHITTNTGEHFDFSLLSKNTQ